MNPTLESGSDEVATVKHQLTAALRWADRLGLSEGVCNHFSAVVPGAENRYLINPQGIHWSELCVSDLVVIDGAGKRVAGRHEVEPTAFHIHHQVHRSRPSAQCVLHTHMPYATALSCLREGHLSWTSQNAVRFFGRVAYEESYNGLALDPEEGDRISRKLAQNDVLFLGNHGVLVCGNDVPRAFDDLYYLEQACRVQILALSTGLPLAKIAPEVCQQTSEQFERERQQSYLFLQAIERILDREAPEWRS